MSTAYRIGIAGLGTVGVGVIKILETHGEKLARKCGRAIEITHVSARDRSKDRGVDLSKYTWVDKTENLADQDLDCVIELVGGSEGTAKTLAEKTIQSGKDYVTANKALMAHHGAALADLSMDSGSAIAYEAAVAGGIPIIKAMREGYAANDIDTVYGILNGTCNYILTTMRESGRDFRDVLKDAQELGYAEADPTFDVEGVDAGHKLALLTALAFGVRPDFDALPITGISNIGAVDIAYAEQLGYKIKLLGIASKRGDKIMQVVEPCFVSKDVAIGNVEGVLNAVRVNGDFMAEGLLVGRGAGEGPTASSVVADIMDLAAGRALPCFGIPVADLKEAQWEDLDEMESRFYVRLNVTDTPGVLADISSILNKYAISIEDIVQRGAKEGQPVPIVLTTHMTLLGIMKQALAEMEAQDYVFEKPCLIRIEEF